MNMFAGPSVGVASPPDLDALERHYQSARKDLFDAHLASIIRHVSPLTIDALAVEGLHVDEVVDRFRPPPNWPQVQLPVHDTFRPLGYDFLTRSSRRSQDAERRFARRHQSGAACVIRGAGAASGALGVRLSGSGIEMAILTDDYLLTTAAGKGRLQVLGALPLTIGGAMLGRPVDDLVGHPLLEGRDYPVKGVTHLFGDGSSLIVFETGRRRYGRG